MVQELLDLHAGWDAKGGHVTNGIRFFQTMVRYERPQPHPFWPSSTRRRNR